MRHNLLINGRFLTQSITGVQRYAIELVKAFDAMVDSGQIDRNQVSVVILSPKNATHTLDLKHIPVKRAGRLTGHCWEQLELPVYAKEGLLLNLCNTGPILKRNQVVTIHDASTFALPANYPFAFRAWYGVLLRMLGRTCRYIVTDSLFSKSELIRYCGIDDRKLRVITLGKEHIFDVEADDSILQRHNLGERPFILAVSSMAPNKNFASIVKAVDLLGDVNFDIVIAGGTNPRVFRMSTNSLPDSVKYIGYISDAELRALYEHAACFIHPALYEGFGLTPLEAMACGCPVIVSNAASIPEVCGDAALYFDPHNSADLASKISLLMGDPGLQINLRTKGLERSRLFTWKDAARQMLQLYEDLLIR